MRHARAVSIPKLSYRPKFLHYYREAYIHTDPPALGKAPDIQAQFGVYPTQEACEEAKASTLGILAQQIASHMPGRVLMEKTESGYKQKVGGQTKTKRYFCATTGDLPS